jgi:hypothetical protein
LTILAVGWIQAWMGVSQQNPERMEAFFGRFGDVVFAVLLVHGAITLSRG